MVMRISAGTWRKWGVTTIEGHSSLLMVVRVTPKLSAVVARRCLPFVEIKRLAATGLMDRSN